MGFSLSTGRLVLEDMVPGDLQYIRRIARDRDVMKYVLIWLETEEQVAAFLDHAIGESRKGESRRDYMLAARVPGTGQFAGFVFIRIDDEADTSAEVGYILLPEFWGAGYALEALNALLAFGFTTLGLRRVYGKCDDLNARSARVMEKGGLTYEGTIREHVWLRDHWRSTRYYGMLAAEYRAAPGGYPPER